MTFASLCSRAAIAVASFHTSAARTPLTLLAAICGRMHTEEEALVLVDLFLTTPFTRDERHVRRIALITKYENDGKI